ncbi:hypothetical protein [Lactobacillus crispatus]|uniref:Uncharacterized protein n=1 Tax=Lactobacillus crispatus (strain ST1) TaxID=748671 RepID=D5H148_LACCS|nr:hypothetical protein [Lactobacillus crispatus]KAA8809986.1 hypothetical protein F1C08_06585 [Lactobacillus crispatus]MDK6377745.1 hypothetical protein [Lactobacillus crispatus]MDK8508433.1 hypothetical protein [Lactobacillus crispatus]QGY94225.1 hypothetical protein E6A57_01425 [Lactobacillus crispatus]CBL49733.1 putative protein without homology [Lactobacillus crispatus ST1]
MKKNKFKQKIKQISVVSLVGLALSPLLSSTSVVLADEVDHQNDSNYTTISVGDLLSQFRNTSTSSNLPVNKENELTNLKEQFQLSDEDANFLKQQYLKNHPNDPLASSKWKTAAAKAAAKVAVPILKKFAKKAGVKLGDRAIENVIAIITGVEDNVQGRLYKALRNMGFSKYWAGVASRAITFVLF